MLIPMNVVMLSLVSICVLFTPWLRRRGGEGEGCACLESERRERRYHEPGRERRGPVRVVGRRHKGRNHRGFLARRLLRLVSLRESLVRRHDWVGFESF